IISGDPNYDGLVTDGIDVSVTRPNQGQVIIDQPKGFTAVTEGTPNTSSDTSNDDRYGVRLAQAPLPGTHVYVIASAPVAPQEEIGNTGLLGVGDVVDNSGNEDTLLLSTTPGVFTRQIVLNGTTYNIPLRATVLVFDSTNWSTDQYVNVRAADDTAKDLDR